MVPMGGSGGTAAEGEQEQQEEFRQVSVDMD